MDETYRTMGRGREADFAREAASRRLAAEARGASTDARKHALDEMRKTRRAHLRARLALLLLAPAQRREARNAL
jgi:hypothetical protein